MEMAKIGATPKGGCNRQTLTDLDREGRDLFRRWCEAAGCTVTVDEMGNMMALRPGRRGPTCRPSSSAATSTPSRPAASSTACSACWPGSRWCAR